MKVIALLISIYILYLVSLPCMDGAACVDNQHSEQTTHHDQGDEHNHADGCSPFCICACCSVTVIITTFHFESDHSYIPVEVNIPQKQGFSSTDFQFIWQPPQLS